LLEHLILKPRRSPGSYTYRWTEWVGYELRRESDVSNHEWSVWHCWT